MIFLPKKTGCLARFFLASWFWQVGYDLSVIVIVTLFWIIERYHAEG